mmetsp:Transcript_121987/g.379738  ORF Transcript_121987/g.379738 Transcript_121987/m.379738 type:complete len:389 (-) Transcript_121987:264-1430(-)
MIVLRGDPPDHLLQLPVVHVHRHALKPLVHRVHDGLVVRHAAHGLEDVAGVLPELPVDDPRVRLQRLFDVDLPQRPHQVRGVYLEVGPGDPIMHGRCNDVVVRAGLDPGYGLQDICVVVVNVRVADLLVHVADSLVQVRDALQRRQDRRVVGSQGGLLELLDHAARDGLQLQHTFELPHGAQHVRRLLLRNDCRLLRRLGHGLLELPHLLVQRGRAVRRVQPELLHLLLEAPDLALDQVRQGLRVLLRSGTRGLDVCLHVLQLLVQVLRQAVQDHLQEMPLVRVALLQGAQALLDGRHLRPVPGQGVADGGEVLVEGTKVGHGDPLDGHEQIAMLLMQSGVIVLQLEQQLSERAVAARQVGLAAAELRVAVVEGRERHLELAKAAQDF